MSKKMLIDASHPEETRVVVVNGTRVEELDFESRNKRQLRGNVYLARVTRVEPSLQAAFVEYGGNRHGFLAFSEIHPDYYQIPYEDRMALMEDEEADLGEEDEDEQGTDDEALDDEAEEEEDERDVNLDPDEDDVNDEADGEVAAEQVKVASKRRQRMSRRRYKIQEVIKRGQIMLIQAVKEERGNKGAAMTTYLSLAGRYCVLMPNTPRGGGISRKIANGSDRKRLKSIMSELEVPQGMGVIVRTAGGKRTKVEIKRDYDYLSRLWETIRETTLESIAPALIHEEGNLVKRSIRDLYNKDIEEILVQGDDAYKTAKDFIKMLMPSHAKNVKSYKETIPLFLRYQVEKQIEASLDSVVQLKSGGYLVIHPTEALVSVDVNSGRSTRERNIERTALKTNLEAAEEVARQMRLRDLAGLIVIDFIDMDEHKNNRAVEKRMRDCLTQDRARVQTDRISQFGLMEISRQRRRRSLLEGSTTSCEHCEGVGRKRTIESSALVAIRAVEEIGARRQMKRIRLKVSPDVAIYIFNEKRDLLQRVDDEFDMFTELVGDDTLIRPSFIVDSIENREKEDDPLAAIEEQQKRDAKALARRPKKPAREETVSDSDDIDETEDKSEASDSEKRTSSETDENGEPRKRRRRRGRRGGRGKRTSENQTEAGTEGENTSETQSDTQEETETVPTNGKIDNAADTDKPSKPRRTRGRRKAPARSRDDEPNTSETSEDAGSFDPVAVTSEANVEKPRRSSSRRKAPGKRPAKEAVTAKAPVETETAEPEIKAEAPKRRRRAPAKKVKAEASVNVDMQTSEPEVLAKPKRRRKAPAKASAKKTIDLETEEKPVKKTRATRKAPTKRAPSKAQTETPAEAAPTKRASAHRKAPSKTSSVKTSTKATTSTQEEKAEANKRKAPARRAAPARKAKTPETAKVEVAKKPPAKKKAPAKKAPEKPIETSGRTRRKAPARKVEATPATKADPEPRKVETPVKVQAPTKVDTPVTEKPKKKRGWLSRLTKGE